MARVESDRLEWLEADGLGGFASGTSTGIRTRRYHALLLSAATPPTGRQVLVSGVDVAVQTGDRTAALSSQRYAPGVIHPDGASRIEAFEIDPWPTWRYRLGETLAIEHAVFVVHGCPMTVLRWRAIGGDGPLRLIARIFIGARDYHSLQHENGAFRFDAEIGKALVRWRPYDGVQPIVAASNGAYVAQPDWYRNFLYSEERARGLDAVEDLATPGRFEWDLRSADATLILAADTPRTAQLLDAADALLLADRLAEQERRRRATFAGRLDRSADAYIVRRQSGATIVAGYPWFTDWGRDTFIALRGLCLATGRFDEARQILSSGRAPFRKGCCPTVSRTRGAPEFNAVDASLWFVVAAYDWMTADPSIDDPLAIARGFTPQSTRSSRATPPAPVSAFARTTTGSSRPARLVCSSPGWTPVSAIAWSRPAPESQSRFRRCGSTRCGLGRTVARWADLFKRAFASFGPALLESRGTRPVRRRRRRSRCRHGGCDVPSQSDPCRRRASACLSSRGNGRLRSSMKSNGGS